MGTVGTQARSDLNHLALPNSARYAGGMSEFPDSLKAAIRILEDLKAEDLKVLNVGDVSSVTDYFVLATGTSAPHLRALAEELEVTLKDQSIKARRKAGTPGSGWVVMDFLDVVIHIMTPELREFYALEQLWNDAKTVKNEVVLGK